MGLEHDAARSGDISAFVKLIMKGNFNVNAKDENGKTVLHIACERNNVMIIKHLLRRQDVDTGIKDKAGKTALQCAPAEARKSLTMLFSKMEAKKQTKTNKKNSADRGRVENEEMLDEMEKDADVVSPSTMRKLIACVVLPFVVLIFINGIVFALKFVSVALVFYYASLAYFVAEIALRPPWYHHHPGTGKLAMRNCPDYWQGWIHDPKTDFNLDYEDIEFESSDNYVLKGWYVPPPPADTVPTQPIGIVLVHGGGRDRRTWVRHVPFLHKHGYGCLLFDMREHGLSSGNGKGFTFGIRERYDVISACEVMRSRFGHEHICAMGTSVGGASAIMAGAIDTTIDCVIAENAITTSATLLDQQIVAMIGGYFSQHAYSVFLFKIFRRVAVFWLNLRIGNKPSKHCQALHCIDRISPRPILLMHGTTDTIVPSKHSQILFDAAREPKELYMCEGAFHCGLYNTHPEEYEKRVLDFLAKATRGLKDKSE